MKGMKGSRAQLGVNAFQREMDESMARMMQDMHGPGYVGQADIDFLAMMIPHHAGAVDMARLVLQQRGLGAAAVDDGRFDADIADAAVQHRQRARDGRRQAAGVRHARRHQMLNCRDQQHITGRKLVQ